MFWTSIPAPQWILVIEKHFGKNQLTLSENIGFPILVMTIWFVMGWKRITVETSKTQMQFVFYFSRFIAMTSTQLIEIAIDHFYGSQAFIFKSVQYASFWFYCLFICISNELCNIYAKKEHFMQSISLVNGCRCLCCFCWQIDAFVLPCDNSKYDAVVHI